MILGVPINGLVLLVTAAVVSVGSRLLGGDRLLERVLGTLSAPCAEVCTLCCDEVRFDGSCSCEGRLEPLPIPPSRRGDDAGDLEPLPAPPSRQAQ